jgi:hypothetical protein
MRFVQGNYRSVILAYVVITIISWVVSLCCIDVSVAKGEE